MFCVEEYDMKGEHEEKYDNFPEERKEYAALILNEVERCYGHTILWQAPREQEAFSIDLAESAKVCCFTGNRPEKLSRSEKEVKKLLVGSILDSYEVGYRVFISGMARGVDQWAAMVVLTLRCFYSDIRLVAALPFPATKKQSIDEETMILYVQNCLFHFFKCRSINTEASLRSFKMKSICSI